MLLCCCLCLSLSLPLSVYCTTNQLLNSTPLYHIHTGLPSPLVYPTGNSCRYEGPCNNVICGGGGQYLHPLSAGNALGHPFSASFLEGALKITFTYVSTFWYVPPSVCVCVCVLLIIFIANLLLFLPRTLTNRPSLYSRYPRY